jgi:hypothetical protein
MANTNEIQARLAAALTDYRAKANTAAAPVVRAASEKVRAIQAELVAAFTEGAAPCPNCGHLPIGMAQTVSVKNMTFAAVEIGCLNCPATSECSFAALGLSRDEAVANWNAGPEKWMPAKPRNANGGLLQHGRVGTSDG